MGISVGDHKKEKEQIRHMFSLDLDKGVLVNLVDTIKYSMQYAQNGCLLYLFNEENVFVVPGNVYDGGIFTLNGELLNINELKNKDKKPIVVNDEKVLNYLNDRDILKNELIKKG